MSEKQRRDWGQWVGVVVATLGLLTTLQMMGSDGRASDFALVGLLPVAWLLSHVFLRPAMLRKIVGVAFGGLLLLVGIILSVALNDETSTGDSTVAGQAGLLTVNAILLLLCGPVLIVASVRGRAEPADKTAPPPPLPVVEPVARSKPTFAPAAGRRRCPQCASPVGITMECVNCGYPKHVATDSYAV